jgi:hypothetical protein
MNSEATEANTAPDVVECGSIPVDSGMILVVDPCNIPKDLLRKLTTPNEHGVTVAALVNTPAGDGWYPVVGEDGALLIVDPYGNLHEETGGGWGPVDGPKMLDDIEALHSNPEWLARAAEYLDRPAR